MRSCSRRVSPGADGADGRGEAVPAVAVLVARSFSVVLPSRFCTVDPGVAAARSDFFSGNANGMVASAAAANVNIAAAHPHAAIVACAIGANTNWPSDPPALIVPAAVDR